MFSRTKNLMYFTGNGDATLYNNRNAFVVPNSVYQSGTDAEGNPIYSENTTALDLYGNGIQTYYDGGGVDGGNSLLVSRSYIKLRELAFTWNLPRKWTNPIKVQNISLSFVANNLLTWTPSSNMYIDPDVSSYGTDLFGSFGELYSNVSTRKFGINLKVKF